MQFRDLDSMSYERRERGFALVTALIAAIIMLALGILVIQLSTQDLKSGSAAVGEKKALTAADTGVHKLMQTFDPLVTLDGVPDTVVDETNAPGDRYSYGTADDSPDKGPASVTLPGYSIAGQSQWGLTRYDVDVTGKNVRYNTEVNIGIGVGHGPIEITPKYK